MLYAFDYFEQLASLSKNDKYSSQMPEQIVCKSWTPYPPPELEILYTVRSECRWILSD